MPALAPVPVALPALVALPGLAPAAAVLGAGLVAAGLVGAGWVVGLGVSANSLLPTPPFAISLKGGESGPRKSNLPMPGLAPCPVVLPSVPLPTVALPDGLTPVAAVLGVGLTAVALAGSIMAGLSGAVALVTAGLVVLPGFAAGTTGLVANSLLPNLSLTGGWSGAKKEAEPMPARAPVPVALPAMVALPALAPAAAVLGAGLVAAGLVGAGLVVGLGVSANSLQVQ